MGHTDVIDAVHSRRALRVFDARPIEIEKISAMVEAMRLAPTCNNNQPQKVVIARSAGSLTKVKEALNKGNVWATAAPMIMAIAARPADDCRLNEGRDYYLFACGLAVGEMVLMATELGIIAHPIAGFDPIKVREALNIPSEYVVITLVICGYPGTDDSLLSDKQKAVEKERMPRKPVGENFFLDTWNAPYPG